MQWTCKGCNSAIWEALFYLTALSQPSQWVPESSDLSHGISPRWQRKKSVFALGDKGSDISRKFSQCGSQSKILIKVSMRKGNYKFLLFMSLLLPCRTNKNVRPAQMAMVALNSTSRNLVLVSLRC